MKFRTAYPQDLPRLLPLIAAFHPLEGIPWQPARVRPALEQLLASPTLGQVLIAETEDAAGEVAGYAILTYGFDLEFAGRDAYLTDLFLLPDYRGQGLGQRFLAVVEQAARGAGVQAIHLQVRRENTAAWALYQRSGFHGWPRAFLSKELDGVP